MNALPTTPESQRFNPAELVQLARAQWRNEPHLAKAFSVCLRHWPKDACSTSFIHPDARKDDRGFWHYAFSRELVHPTEGELIVDILHDPIGTCGPHRIGAIEYLDRIEPIDVTNAVDYSEKDFEEEIAPGFVRHRSAMPFDAAPFVACAREQWADRPELIKALEACKLQWPESELYTQLFDPKREVRISKKWLNAGGLTLQCPVDGELLIEFVRHPTIPSRLAIFGIEYMDKVMGRHRSKTTGFVIAHSGKARSIAPMNGTMRVVRVK